MKKGSSNGLRWAVKGAEKIAKKITGAQENTETTSSSLWEPYIEAARDAWWHGDHEKAGNILVVALKDAEDYGEIDPCLVRSVENLAQLFRSRGKHAEAEWLQLQVFETLEKLLGSDHPDVINCFDKLAAIVEEWEEERSEGGYSRPGSRREDWSLLVVEEGEECELAADSKVVLFPQPGQTDWNGFMLPPAELGVLNKQA